MKTIYIILTIIFFMPCRGHAESLIDKIDRGINDRTDILAIYKDDKIIYQEYRNGYQPDQKHKLWSMSKSITSLLVARAVKEGRLQVESSICDYISIAELSSSLQCNMTIEDLLFWQSGTQWAEDYIGFDGEKSNVLNGLYGVGINNFSNYYFSLPYAPNTELNWNYSTGDSHILSYLLRKVYSPFEYEKLPWSLLFDPLGIQEATFERDHTGTYLGGAYVYLSHKNLHRLAQLVMREMEEPRFLPEQWMSLVLTAKNNTVFNLEMAEEGIAPAIPGGHWWLNRPTEAAVQEIPWPRMPEDTFAAFGVFGQMMFIIPSEKIVIIRLAQDIKGGFDRANMLDIAVQYAREYQL